MSNWHVGIFYFFIFFTVSIWNVQQEDIVINLITFLFSVKSSSHSFLNIFDVIETLLEVTFPLLLFDMIASLEIDKMTVFSPVPKIYEHCQEICRNFLEGQRNSWLWKTGTIKMLHMKRYKVSCPFSTMPTSLPSFDSVCESAPQLFIPHSTIAFLFLSLSLSFAIQRLKVCQ